MDNARFVLVTRKTRLQELIERFNNGHKRNSI